MTPFKLPRSHQKRVNTQIRAQQILVNGSMTQMTKVAKAAIDYIIEHWQKTGRYAEPALHQMDEVMDTFYYGLVTKAVDHARDELGEKKKRLAKRDLPYGLPKDIKSLEQIFRDRKYWPKIMKRSKVITRRMRQQYQQKLRKTFEKLVPQMLAGEVTVEEAKQKLVDRWSATASRVETVFRTETTNYFARTQVNYFKGVDSVIGFLFDSVRDTSRTDICRDRHGLIYRPGSKLLTENTPALHYNCRSHLIPLVNTDMNRKMMEDPRRDPTKKQVAPIPPEWRK